MRRLAPLAALMLAFSPVGYVRRGYIPKQACSSVAPDGSRDRTLPGKTRVKARRTA